MRWALLHATSGQAAHDPALEGQHHDQQRHGEDHTGGHLAAHRDVAISQFQGKTGRDIPVGSQMAAGVILTVPLLIMVLAFQRRIVSGLTAGGVK